MSSDAFQKEYRGLNVAQKDAVDSIEGPVMVIAGPGTGKTQILTLRIANILEKTDTQPEQILALTFTDAAAQNMRKRLVGFIGNRAYQVVINTFHGFCNDTIRRYPEDFPRIIGSRPITEIDQVTIIESILGSRDWTLLKPWGDPHLYVRDIVSAISDLKREGVDPIAFKSICEKEKREFASIPDLYHEKGPHKGKMRGDYQKFERKILKNEELAEIYRLYQETMTDQKQYDFNDMVLEVLTTLERSPSLLQMLQEEHQYVLIDEHQDTNNAQNRILELLMSYHNNPNLFIVGDEKQAIFRFQGASLENFHYFKSKYSNVKLITLTENYRSTQSILDTAGKLIEGEKLHKRSVVDEKQIHIGEFSNELVERYFVVHDIQQKINQGISPGDIAILYRNNKDAFQFAHNLERLQIPYQIESDQDLFTHPDVRTILSILRAVAEYGNDEPVTQLLHLPLFGIDPLDVYRVLRSAADRKKYTLYDVISDKELLSEIHLQDRERLFLVGQKLNRWVKECQRKDLLQFFESIIRGSGLLKDILGSENSNDRFSAIYTFFDELRQFTDRNQEGTLQEFFTYLETIKKHKLFLKRAIHVSASKKVRLMTVHKSKGQEFVHVYIVRAIDGVFGGKIERDRLPLLDSVFELEGKKDSKSKEISDGSSQDDERRLFYVAITRAKESVTITYARVGSDGRETLPSRFIEEIRSELTTDIQSEEWEDAFRNDPGFQFQEIDHTSKQASQKEIQEYVIELFEKQGLSPTALNNYLECPWKYFYQNLIRIPAAPTIHQHYGIAVHGALQDLFKRINSEETGKDFLLESFKGNLNRLSISGNDRDELLRKGEKALSGWYDTYHDSWNTNVITEFRINGVILNDGTKLTGVLDKMEFVDDSIVNVVDYKTGKPKTRNDLMGKTKSGNGNYYRQLVFYKLLLNNFADNKYSMQSGTIDFIEPDEKGKYRKETFEIPDDEVSFLESLIKETANDITSLSFWDTRCGEDSCEFCRLRNMISL